MALFSPKSIAGAGFWLLLFASPFLRGLDAPTSFTLDFPVQPNLATPLWLGHPVLPPTTFASLNVPVIPPDANASLLVTLFFQEKEGGFLRISWQGNGIAQTLSDNFYEGIAMNNQRSLLISPQALQGQGTLNFQSSSDTLGISRIKFEWVENKTALVSPQVQDVLVTSANGSTQPVQVMNGAPKPEETAAWHDQFVTVPIADAPQRIEQGVEFSVQLDALPSSGRLVLKENGLSMDKHLVVWINQQRAGTISPAVPDLIDEGFFTDTTTFLSYIGWRDGSFYVPIALLKVGSNTVQFSVEDDVLSTKDSDPNTSSAPVLPLAVKSVDLQLHYPPQPAPDITTPQAATTPDATPIPTQVPTPDSPAPTETNQP